MYFSFEIDIFKLIKMIISLIIGSKIYVKKYLFILFENI